MKINKRSILTGMSMFLILMLTYCKKDPETTQTTNEVKYDATLYNFQPGPFPMPDFRDNPPTVEGVKLGRMLFYEKMMSKDGSISCGSCHLQSNGFTDTSRFSKGVGGSLGDRQAMTVFNTAWHNNEFFWDGRAHLLRDQSLQPIENPVEMAETHESVIAKLSANQMYRDQFKRAFDSEEITEEKMSLAMEQFMNTIVSNKSKYDKYKAGQVTLTASEERGRELFFLEYNEFLPDHSGADCAHCHAGFNFSNDQYMNNGLDGAGMHQDKGREKVTNNPMDRGKFKVPSLRNIELTAPYMHDGRFKTLEEVIDHYNSGVKESPSLDPAIRPTMSTGLRLSAQDKADLIAFLKTLTDPTIATDERFSDPFK
ncbi:MAG: c-type cytochrome [Chitinophagales bacterium]|nr:c-type cytochrome [Chitinophagaceae bacterium]MCB9065832.1 c-type cytochrome [Chitinophagales bacterium]